jgi:hypothetical protein
MTEQQIYNILITRIKNAAGTKPYKHDARLIANELYIRSKHNKYDCKTKIDDKYLRSLSHKLGLQLVTAPAATHNRIAAKNAAAQAKRVADTVRDWNRFFLNPVVLKRGYAS